MSIFKVWDEKSKEWLDEICDVCLLPSGEVLAGDLSHSVVTLPKESVFLYSNQEDKYKNKVYDGSIVRIWSESEYVPNRDSGGGIIDYDFRDGHCQIGLIVFENGSFNYYSKKEQYILDGLVLLKDDIEESWNIKGVPIDFIGAIDGFEVIGHKVNDTEYLI